MREVVYVDGVIDIDWFDTLALVDTPIMVSDVARKIEKIPGVGARPARIMAVPEW